MAGTFPPDYFAPDYFAPEYFGGEVNANAMSAAIAGSSSVTASLSVAVAADQDYDSHWQYAREQKKKRARKKRVVGVLAAKIVGRGRVYGILGSTPTLVVQLETPQVEPWVLTVNCRMATRGKATFQAFIEGPDRIEEQDWRDLEDILDLYEILLAA